MAARRWTCPGLALAALLAAPAVAHATGAAFASAPGTVHVRSVLAAFDAGPEALTLEVALELTGTATRVVWVLPLPALPLAQVEEATPEALDAREDATAWQVTLPLPEGCPVKATASSAGCGCGDPPPPAAAPTLAHPEAPVAQIPVTVRGAGRATISHLEVFEGISGAALVSALRDANQAVSAASAAALVEALPRPGPVLWVEAASDPGARRLPVLRLRLPPDTQPSLPLRITAPQVDVRLDLRVLLTADGPSLAENWVGITPLTDEILFDDQGRTSYGPWVARACAAGSGHVFAIEAVVTEPDDRVTTRLYALTGAEQLDRDPAFRPHPQPTLRSSPLLDLAAAPSLLVCDEVEPTRLPAPCAFNFCGPSTEGVVVEDRASCRCPVGAAAAVIEGPDGTPSVACTPAERLSAAEPPGAPDPCVNLDCGAGTCLARGGEALCACASSAVAQLGPQGLRCVSAPADTPTFGPGGGVESRGAALVRAAGLGSGAVFALLGVLFLSRRRRSAV
ncbi:MAG: hypothetical protein KC933_18265 [Myxococcales bacterium]|nr:hypothetical protein [Myxococcales bacterium]